MRERLIGIVGEGSVGVILDDGFLRPEVPFELPADRKSALDYLHTAFCSLLRQGAEGAICRSGLLSALVSDDEVEGMNYPLCYGGAILPGLRKAAAMSARGRIGVLDNGAAVRSGAYGRALRAIAPWAKIYGVAKPSASGDLEACLKPLKEQKVDTLLVGCIQNAPLCAIINDILGYRVTIIDAEHAAEQHLRASLLTRGALTGGAVSA